MNRLQINNGLLRGFVKQANAWLNLPLAELAVTPFGLDVGLGGRYDAHLRLKFGNDPNLISAQNSTVSFEYEVATVTGNFSYVVDQSGIRQLIEGIESALDEAIT